MPRGNGWDSKDAAYLLRKIGQLQKEGKLTGIEMLLLYERIALELWGKDSGWYRLLHDAIIKHRPKPNASTMRSWRKRARAKFLTEILSA